MLSKQVYYFLWYWSWFLNSVLKNNDMMHDGENTRPLRNIWLNDGNIVWRIWQKNRMVDTQRENWIMILNNFCFFVCCNRINNYIIYAMQSIFSKMLLGSSTHVNRFSLDMSSLNNSWSSISGYHLSIIEFLLIVAQYYFS